MFNLSRLRFGLVRQTSVSRSCPAEADKLQFVVVATFVDKPKFVGRRDSVRTDRNVHFQDGQGASQII
jgi:hypothetical protein